MMPSFFPGNLAMKLRAGSAPTGVAAVNASSSRWSEWRWERKYASSLRCPALPMGLGPIATTSRTYCMARAGFTRKAVLVPAGDAVDPMDTGSSKAASAVEHDISALEVAGLGRHALRFK